MNASTWYHWAVYYDSTNDILYLAINNNVYNVDCSSANWGTANTSDYVQVAVSNDYDGDTYLVADDVLIVSGVDVGIQKAINHYKMGVPWGYNEGDIILKPASGGRVIFDDQAEESVGTLHFITPTVIVDGVNPSDTDWHAVDISSVVPQGTKAVYILTGCRSTSTGGYQKLNVGPDGATIYVDNGDIQVAGINNWEHGITPISADRKIYWKASSTDVDFVYITIKGYFI